MDYIEQQLLRQRRALAALMSGSRSAAEPETAAEELPFVREAAAQSAAVERRLRQQSAGREAAPALRAAAAIYRPETAGWGETRVVFAAGQADGTDAQAVSRAIQRDARRYDGGFSLY